MTNASNATAARVSQQAFSGQFLFRYQRRHDETVAWANRALEIDPKHLLAGMFLAGVYWKTGDVDRFIAQMVRTATAYGVSDEALASLNTFTGRVQQVYAQDGFAGWSRFLADEIGFMSDVAFRRAVLYAHAGCLDAAFECLDEAIAVRTRQWCTLRLPHSWTPGAAIAVSPIACVRCRCLVSPERTRSCDVANGRRYRPTAGRASGLP